MAVENKNVLCNIPTVSAVLNNPTKFYCKYTKLFLKVILRK